MIPKLQPPDSLHVMAAQGWLELGKIVGANDELEKVKPELRTHPGVLEVRWHIYAVAKKWGAALDIAESLIRLAPDYPGGYLRQAHALHGLNRTGDARVALLGALDKFPDNAFLRYNLACYECLLGNLEPARQWLEKAFQLGDAEQMKLKALDDPDLEPLWKEICGQ